MQHPDNDPAPGNAPRSATWIGKTLNNADRANRQRRLILVGASVRAAAESAHRAGFIVSAVDLFGDRETQAVAEKWCPLSTSAKETDRVSLAGMTTENARIAIAGGVCGDLKGFRDLGLPFHGAPPQIFDRCDHPKFLRAIARQAGVGFPRTQVVSATDANRVRPERYPGPPGWLIKHRRSSGGLGVRCLPASCALRIGDLLQRRISGRVYGATYVGDGRSAVWIGLSRLMTRRIGDRPFAFAGCLGPLSPSDAVAGQLRRLGDAIAAAIGIRGPFNADVVLKRNRVWLIEINPRYSASMEVIEAACCETVDTSSSFFDSAARWRQRFRAIADAPPTFYDAGPLFLKRILFARSAGRLDPDDFPIADAAAETEGPRWYWKDVPARATMVAKDEPAVTLMVRLTTEAPIRAQLSRAYRIAFPLHPIQPTLNRTS